MVGARKDVMKLTAMCMHCMPIILSRLRFSFHFKCMKMVS